MLRRVSLISVFWFSAIATIALFGVVGFGLGASALVTMLTLTMLEIAFSLDNAVINATVLQKMSLFWQRMFMTVGIIIAVFGMRLLFPLVLVSVTAGIDFTSAIVLALQHPAEYSIKLAQAEPMIATFGGLFLLMIFLSFVLDSRRKFPWRTFLKRTLKKLNRWHTTEIFIAALVLGALIATSAQQMRFAVAIAGLLGISAHLVVGVLADAFSTRQPKRIGGMSWHQGLILFLYLELLDASFSFDSVIGAFAVTTNALLIAAGLGAGALWVRSITIYAVRRGVLAHYPYLDGGAHFAIGALAVMLLLSIHITLPDALTGGIGLLIILTSFLASIWKNRQVARAAKSGV